MSPSSARWLVRLALVAVVACAGPPVTPQGFLPESYDRSVARAVTEELAREPAVADANLTVDVRQGVVMLGGSARNLLAARRAEEITGAVRGVRGVVNRIEVEPAVVRSDLTLQRAAEEALLFHPATDALDIQVKVENGIAVLNGSVGSMPEAELAQEVLAGVDGLRGVSNQLTVDFEGPRGDRDIQAEVEALLWGDVMVDTDLLQVRVQDGRVLLAGTVGRLSDLNRAASKAWVRGVKEVNVEAVEVEAWARNENLRARDPEFIPDASIERAVELALFYDPRVPANAVNVEVSQGTIILTGEVDTLEAKRAAFEDAQSTLGANFVDDHVTVRPVPVIDEQLAAAVEQGLSRHPFLNADAIEVSVEAGAVVLRGAVNSAFERAAADEVAGQVQGVHAVYNDLVIRGSAGEERPPEIERPPAPPAGTFPPETTRQDIPGQGMHVLQVRSLALAHCQQQERCGFIGETRKYASLEACVASVPEVEADRLEAFKCTAGVNRTTFEDCLVELRIADCALPFSAIDSFPACDPVRICSVAK